MLSISHMPLVRIFLPFLAGIILAASFNVGITREQFLLVSIFIFLFLIFAKKQFQSSYSNRWVFGVLVTIFYFLAGNVLTISNNELKKHNHFSCFLEKGDYALIEISEPVSERKNSFRIVGNVKNTFSDSLAFKTTGKVMLYVEKDSLAATLKYGDQIITKTQFYKVNPPYNPHQFNYKRHLFFNNIHYQGYRSSGNYMVVASGKGNFIISTALQIRQKALETMQEFHVQDREFAVLSALLLGYREYIDDELREQFAGAGAMHILCVSGLHVGIIFIIINSIFSFLNKIKNGKIIKTIIVILLIWFYATLTGFSPSVLRASTMFSFVALARSSNRYTNIYNTLAASALLLTIINPYIATKIGFQLSYLAVISIVALQPHLYKLVYFKNPILDKIWAITTVSIAAQIATGPLALYYFNIFPNYFILTNLAVIPLSSVIIYSALIFLAFSPIGFIAEIMGKILSLIVFCMHKSVQYIDALPYSNLQNVNISLAETMLWLFLFTLIALFFIRKSKSFLKLALPVIIFLAVSFSVKNIFNQRKNAFIVYSINNHTAIDFVSGKECVFLACEELLSNDNQNVDFNISQNRIKNSIRSVDKLVLGKDTTVTNPQLWKKNGFVLFNNLKIKVITEFDQASKMDSLPSIKLDYIIISQNPFLDIVDLKSKYDFEKIIIDSSNPLWKANRWEAECEELEIDSWSVRRKGAYIRNI